MESAESRASQARAEGLEADDLLRRVADSTVIFKHGPMELDADICNYLSALAAQSPSVSREKADAERYRWLRDFKNDDAYESIICLHEERMDTAIDLALAQKKRAAKSREERG